MTAANVLASLALLFWALMSLAGVSAYRSIVGQHVPGYPNSGQINLYVTVPIVTLVVLLTAVVIANRLGRGAIPLAVLSGASLFVVPMYLAVWSGGV
jgi:hypothetical protein